ncbi:hypothetical protein M406DRAFT_257279 [Cryphonectria parasitica EP155]|uniref:Uncharacterized protein n=1 Tax=Cryphonectria parasitica (strain ATCC 38755 / EP155) TaxID=660469 RepID=A0A9P4Y4F6_CRYP1|nr:uncharacterized protein M406DRAFT_257279 [Cryphonectria parasitica EP155]KAF3766182.1 hypothetical protein M406DRAFT_257279 [Cryphonectria parasitica EP155]
MGFFFNKGVRGGPRVLLNLAAVLFALFVFVKLLPQRMTQSALSSIPISWSALSGHADDGSVPGGLRIVVFGELDVGTPVGEDEEVKGAQTWTQALCDQLSCNTHISMVPSPDVASFSVSSNELYAQGVEKVLNETADKDGPGQDYSYLSTYYPPQWKSSDLKGQIDAFLAMPKPQNQPGETLWVFSFGLWDVFSLSALPVATAKETLGSMTKDVFEQIERLHSAAKDPTSIAYSDINKAAADEPAGDQLEARDEAAAESPAARNQDVTNIGNSFKILIPRIMDPSLLPGWHDVRPQLPVAHSKAEQMRNSATLTNSWNDGIIKGLSDWVKKGSSKQDNKDDKSHEFYFDETQQPSGPTRDGYAYNLAEFIVSQILERQMLNAHLTDGEGRGTGELEDGFRDVSNACLQPVSTVAVAVSLESAVTLNIPNVKVDNDKQVPTQPTPIATAANKRDGLDRKPGYAYTSAARVCEIPSDHLFFTPFALSQRAIQQVAAETAQMVRNGDSVRAKMGS